MRWITELSILTLARCGQKFGCRIEGKVIINIDGYKKDGWYNMREIKIEKVITFVPKNYLEKYKLALGK